MMDGLLLERPFRLGRNSEGQRPKLAEAEHAVKTLIRWSAMIRTAKAWSTLPLTLRGIPFRSSCEHHMAPITGHAHICYLPAGRVVGISKLARVVDAFARRLQIQERMTTEVAAAIDEALQPRGVAVMIEAHHACMNRPGFAGGSEP